MDFMYYALSPFTWLLNFFYSLVDNYGVAIMLFAVVVKVILFPFSLKGKKSMIQMNMMNGKMQKLQKQYGKDKVKYNEAVQNLYTKEGVNPMGGCLWSLLPMFVLLPLYAIIREPLKYMMGLDENQILEIANAVDWNTVAESVKWMSADAIQKAMDASTQAGGIVSGFVDSGYNQLYLASLINDSTMPAVVNAIGAESGVFGINFTFLGLNLAMVPNWRIWQDLSWGSLGLIVLVLISALTGFLFSRITMATNKMNNKAPQNESMERTNKTMMYTMPLMSLWIGFVMPAGLCVYWIANNLLSMVQELIAGRILKKDYEAARLASEERDRLDKEEEKQLKEKHFQDRALRLEEEKKNRGKKKPAVKKVDNVDSNVNKTDSTIGLRAHARGRNYDPTRFGAVTPYSDTQKSTENEEPVEEIIENNEILAIDEAVNTATNTADSTAMEIAQEDEKKEGAE